MKIEELIERLLDVIRSDPNPIDPYAVKIDGENNVIAISDPETGAEFFLSIVEA